MTLRVTAAKLLKQLYQPQILGIREGELKNLILARDLRKRVDNSVLSQRFS